jgi:hypothetical protein
VDTRRDGYEPPAAAAGTETAGTTDGSPDATHEHTDDGSTVTHPDGSTETVTRSSGSSTDDQAKGDPSDPRLEGGTHRA